MGSRVKQLRQTQPQESGLPLRLPTPRPKPMTYSVPSIRDDYLHKFLEDRLEIPCVRIRLTQLTAQEPSVYVGPGSLLLGKTFGLKCKFEAPTPRSSMEDAFTNLPRWEKWELGQLVPVEDYFGMEAVTNEGVRWSCPHVSVNISRTGLDVTEVAFEASHVENLSEADESAYAARLTYVEELRVPKNLRVEDINRNGMQFVGRDGSKGRLANLDLTYVRRFREEPVARSELTIHAVAGNVPPRNFDVRVEETMYFCSALLARPICTEVAHGTLRSILFVKHRPVDAGFALPPIQGRAEQDYYKLASAYYERACKDGDVELMSQLTRRFGSLFGMGAASMAAIALQLSVAVEALAQTGIFQKQVTASSEQKDVADEVKRRVLRMPGLKRLSKKFEIANKGSDRRSLEARLVALLGGLSSGGRTVDVLRLLQRAGAVTAEEIAAWNKLRHPAAHGSWEPQEKQMQVHFDDLYKVMTLVYRLVFAHIGYEGLFTDRSSRSWPVATFSGKNVKSTLLE